MFLIGATIFSAMFIATILKLGMTDEGETDLDIRVATIFAFVIGSVSGAIIAVGLGWVLHGLDELYWHDAATNNLFWGISLGFISAGAALAIIDHEKDRRAWLQAEIDLNAVTDRKLRSWGQAPKEL